MHYPTIDLSLLAPRQPHFLSTALFVIIALTAIFVSRDTREVKMLSPENNIRQYCIAAILLSWSMVVLAVRPPPPIEAPQLKKVLSPPLPASEPTLAKRVLEPELVSIPGGSFTMGCLDGRDNLGGLNAAAMKNRHTRSV